MDSTQYQGSMYLYYLNIGILTDSKTVSDDKIICLDLKKKKDVMVASRISNR